MDSKFSLYKVQKLYKIVTNTNIFATYQLEQTKIIQ